MRTIVFSLAAALAAASPCLADPSAGSTTVTDVVVDASRLPTYLADAPDVQVIDRAQIDARQATFAAQILDTVPGLAVTDDGAFGGVTSVRLRGASSDKTLVLIDGVPQNDASDPNGAYDFANLDLADVERVEILQGPQSALWGSDAIGGVIAFTTRELDGWRAQGEGGSLDTFDGAAGAGQHTDDWAAGISASGYTTNGVSKADGFPERDPYWSWNLGGYGRVALGPNVTLDGHLTYNDSRIHIDGYNALFEFGDTPDVDTSRSWTGDVRAVIDDPWGFKETATFGGYQIDRGGTAPGSNYTADRQDYRWTAERGAPSDAFGIDFGAERESIRASLSTGVNDDLGTTPGFAVARYRPWTPLTLTGSVRYDAPDTYAGQTTARIAGVLKLGGGFSVEGSWGQGFKTPTISEIACDFCDPGSATPLKPEHAEGWDAALAWRSDDGRFSANVTGYQLAVRDQIEFTDAPPFHYINIDRTRTNGLEAEFDAKLTDHLTLQGTYAYTDAIDVDAGTEMLRVPRDTGSASLIWNDGRWGADLTVRAEGPDADENPSTFSPATRPGFVVASLAGLYALTRNIDLTARIEDIANTRYEEALGYGEPGQMLFIGFRARN